MAKQAPHTRFLTLPSEKGVKADTSMMSRFFRRIGVTLKKRRSSRENKTGRT